MSGLTTDNVTLASRIFFNLAYPAGEESVPASRRIFLEIAPGQDLADYHAATPMPANCFQVIRNAQNNVEGYSLRLGCPHFPHLKTKILRREVDGEQLWIFAVDTHDAFSAASFRPPADHPDYERWMQLQENNAELKQKIERGWEDAGLMTFNGLLRRGLNEPSQ